MSERRMGDWNDYEEWAKSKNACTGAPVAIQPGCVVAMAEALDRAEDRIESERRSGEFDPLLEEIRAALALYNGTGVE